MLADEKEEDRMLLLEQDVFGGVGSGSQRIRGSRLAQASLTFQEAFDSFLHDT